MKKKFNKKEAYEKEALERLNNILKEGEKIDFPESLSKDNIERLLNESGNSREKSGNESVRGGSGKSTQKRIMRFIAAAAVLVFVFTSMINLKPWENDTKYTGGNNTAGNNNTENNAELSKDDTERYSELQSLFVGYSKRYQKKYNSFLYKARENLGNMFSASSAADMAVNESSGTVDYKDSAADYGKTNEQVSGVSEADIIKNDGEYLYAVLPSNADWDALYSDSKTYNGAGEEVGKKFTYTCAVSIVKEGKNGELTEVGRLEVTFPEESNIFYSEIKEIYVTGDRLYALVGAEEKRSPGTDGEKGKDQIVVDTIYGYSDASDRTALVSFDISDKKNPKELWRTEQEGSYVSSRMTGGKVVVITDKYVDITASEEEVKDDCIPEASDENGDFGKISSDSIYTTEKIRDSRYAVVSVTDLSEGAKSFKVKAVLGGGENVYCTNETLYVTSSVYEDTQGNSTLDTVTEIFDVSGDECVETEIIKFSISDGFEYCGKATVKGRALNQFSIDEYNGYLRIATTTGSWGDSLENYVTVLDGELNSVGFLEGIAKGETIKSVRFSGDTAYVVTFEQTDPLFVIDLKDPAVPTITGELKIPGFSVYLHPISETLLLGVGVDGDENGSGNGLKISLFDVSDPTSPKETSRYEINGKDKSLDDGSYVYSCIYSSAFYSHKALCFDYENNIVYVPFGTDESSYDPNTGDSKYKNTSGVYAFKIDEKEKTVTLLSEYTSDAKEYFYYNARVTYTGAYVYLYEKDLGEMWSFNKAEDKIVSKLTLK